MPTNHRVRQGDCLASIAYSHGFSADYLWNLGENAKLKQLRKQPEALLPGDSVHVPDQRLASVGAGTESRARFRLKNVPINFKVAFELDNDARANLPVSVKLDGASLGEMTTDSDGVLEVWIMPDAETLQVTIEPARTNPDVLEFTLGGLDPVTTVTGQKARLSNLGLYFGEVSDAQDDELAGAVKKFQFKHGLDETGSVDDATQDKLKEVYGS